MIENIKKITKIVDEITTHLMIHNSKEIEVKIIDSEEHTLIVFNVKNIDLVREEIDALEYSLSIPRQEDVEEYYWQLNGSGETEIELDLIGMLVDTYTLEIEENNLKLELFRNKFTK